MLPSSRTPEGEPLRCPICGASHNVEVSRPPGDSVCPSCGAHAWFSRHVDHIEATKAQIRTYVEELSSLCRNNLPVNQIGEFLLLGLTRCLAAYGAMLWVESRRNWWSLRQSLNMVACVGEPASPDLAQEVIAAKHEIVRDARIGGRETLVIGVPVTRNNRVVGVIEVLQRAGSPAATQKGYVRFVKQTADLVAGCSGLST